MLIIYIISVIMLLLIGLNLFLSYKLYEVPTNQEYFNNVTEINLEKERNIAANPKYIVFISIITGILMGIYLAYSTAKGVHSIIVPIMMIIIFYLYLVELTRSITLKDGVLTLSKLFVSHEIDARRIKGMYIYSYNKKFLKKHAYTTKLVIVEDNDKITKFTLSSIDNRSILNMMKESFGINSNKMFISKREKIKLNEN